MGVRSALQKQKVKLLPLLLIGIFVLSGCLEEEQTYPDHSREIDCGDKNPDNDPKIHCYAQTDYEGYEENAIEMIQEAEWRDGSWLRCAWLDGEISNCSPIDWSESVPVGLFENALENGCTNQGFSEGYGKIGNKRFVIIEENFFYENLYENLEELGKKCF